MANKTEIINETAHKAGVPIKDALAVVEALHETIEGYIRRGEKVTLTGAYIVEVAQRAPRQGRNPQTGESISIPGGPAVKVTPSARWKQIAKGK